MLTFAPSGQELVRLSIINDGYDDEQFPPIFSCVFDRKPSDVKVRSQLSDLIGRPESELPTAAENNIANIDYLLKRRIVICLKQLDSLPGLSKVDDVVLEKGVMRALNEDTEGES